MNTKSGSHPFVFFGEDVFSRAVLESLVEADIGLQPLAAVMLEPLTVSGSRLASFCESRGIPLLRTSSVRSDEFLARLDGMAIDLMVSAHFQRLLPASVFTRARLGALNLHPSLLPRYRGMSPQHWPIILGDTETGVTVHRIDEGVDTGRILRQVSIPIEPDIYIHELQKKFLNLYSTVMVEAVRRAIAGEPGEPQSTKDASYFYKIREEDMEITLATGAARAYNLVRAFSFPYAGARFADLRIMKAKRADAATWEALKVRARALGLIDHAENRYLLLEDGALELTKWRSA
jgi:methionyl-tRNA formyltransferase